MWEVDFWVQLFRCDDSFRNQNHSAFIHTDRIYDL